MRNLLAFIGGAAVTFAGLGWYLGWFQIATLPGSAPGHAKIAFDVNTDKIQHDVSEGVRRGEAELHKVIDHPASKSE